jgi:hypothetical protein
VKGKIHKLEKYHAFRPGIGKRIEEEKKSSLTRLERKASENIINYRSAK